MTKPTNQGRCIQEMRALHNHKTAHGPTSCSIEGGVRLAEEKAVEIVLSLLTFSHDMARLLEGSTVPPGDLRRRVRQAHLAALRASRRMRVARVRGSESKVVLKP